MIQLKLANLKRSSRKLQCFDDPEQDHTSIEQMKDIFSLLFLRTFILFKGTRGTGLLENILPFFFKVTWNTCSYFCECRVKENIKLQIVAFFIASF